MLSVDGSLDYSDLTRRPVRPGDDPVPEAGSYDVYKDFVLSYCVRPVIPTFALMGTVTNTLGMMLIHNGLNVAEDQAVHDRVDAMIGAMGTVITQAWWANNEP